MRIIAISFRIICIYGKSFLNKPWAILLAACVDGDYFNYEFARAHGMRTYEPRQGRNAATVVCSASAVVTLAYSLQF